MSKKLLIVILVVIAVLLVWYFAIYDRGLSDEELKELGAEELSQPDEHTQNLQTQGGGDDLSSIEQDIQDTDLDDLDKELSDIEAQLNSF